MFRVDASGHPVKVDFSPTFASNLGKMIGASDNDAAHACIAQVGFMTIASVLIQSGLADARRGGGLWIRSNYFVCDGTKTLTPPGKRPRKECVRRARATHSYAPFGGQAWNGATAGSLIAFFTLLATDRLVDAASTAEMRALLDKSIAPGNETRSPLTETLPSGGKVFSKLGLVGTYSDAILFERDVVGAGGESNEAAVCGRRSERADRRHHGSRREDQRGRSHAEWSAVNGARRSRGLTRRRPES